LALLALALALALASLRPAAAQQQELLQVWVQQWQ
jgi:hypothetical protein